MRVEELITSQLVLHGVTCAFGVPGTQNVGTYDAVSRSSIGLTTMTHELAAGFAAVGYGRVAGRPAALLAIPGPGITYCVAALAEALHDSVPLVLITQSASTTNGPEYQLQALDERTLLSPVTKSIVELESPENTVRAVSQAIEQATSGTPGPVVLLLRKGLGEQSINTQQTVAEPGPLESPEQALREMADRIRGSRHTLFFASHLIDDVSSIFRRLVENTSAMVMTTPGARGVIAESHSNCLTTDMRDSGVANDVVSKFDLIVSFGVKLSHSNTFGFKLALPDDRLIHISDGVHATSSKYGGSQIRCAPADAVRVLGKIFDEKQTDHLKAAVPRVIPLRTKKEPKITGARQARVSGFFEELREVLPDQSIVVTDTGNHQFFTRRYYSVERPAGLLTPAEFQSMGFGLPAALGAKIAEPATPVVLIIGDGGIRISGMDLTTMARLGIGIPVFVFCDGRFGLIRDQQILQHGRVAGTDLPELRLESLAEAAGANYDLLDDNLGEIVGNALDSHVPTLIEVNIRDSRDMRRREKIAKAKNMIRHIVPRSLTAR